MIPRSVILYAPVLSHKKEKLNVPAGARCCRDRNCTTPACMDIAMERQLHAWMNAKEEGMQVDMVHIAVRRVKNFVNDVHVKLGKPVKQAFFPV